MKAGIIGLGHGSRVLINAFRLSNIEVYGIASKNNWRAEKVRKEMSEIDKKLDGLFVDDELDFEIDEGWEIATDEDISSDKFEIAA